MLSVILIIFISRPGPTLYLISIPCGEQLAYSSRTECYLLSIPSPVFRWSGATIPYQSISFVDNACAVVRISIIHFQPCPPVALSCPTGAFHVVTNWHDPVGQGFICYKFSALSSPGLELPCPTGACHMLTNWHAGVWNITRNCYRDNPRKYLAGKSII